MPKAVLVAFCVGLPVGGLATIPPSQRAWGEQRQVASGQSGSAHRKIAKKGFNSNWKMHRQCTGRENYRNRVRAKDGIAAVVCVGTGEGDTDCRFHGDEGQSCGFQPV
jgi:hypothetical protein